jgi:predicted membrane protein
MVRAGGNEQWAVGLFIVYTLVSALHSLFYYKLVVSAGGVVVGVVQGMRAVGVFVVAALLFCARQESQCFTPMKTLATVVVVTGVLLYVRASGASADAPKAVAAAAAQVTPGVVAAPPATARSDYNLSKVNGKLLRGGVDDLDSNAGVVLA